MSGNTELELLRQAARQLEAEGYDLFLSPNLTALPEFLRSIRPDAVAYGKEKKIVVEVIKPSAQAEQKLKAISQLLLSHPDWELRVIRVVPERSSPEPAIQTGETLKNALIEIDRLSDAGWLHAALLMGWAAFEALARLARPREFMKPQTPGRLVGVLATEGIIMPDDADFLRQLAEKRNRLIHGGLDTDVSNQEVTRFFNILDTLSAPHEQK